MRGNLYIHQNVQLVELDRGHDKDKGAGTRTQGQGQRDRNRDRGTGMVEQRNRDEDSRCTRGISYNSAFPSRKWRKATRNEAKLLDYHTWLVSYTLTFRWHGTCNTLLLWRLPCSPTLASYWLLSIHHLVYRCPPSLCAYLLPKSHSQALPKFYSVLIITEQKISRGRPGFTYHMNGIEWVVLNH